MQEKDKKTWLILTGILLMWSVVNLVIVGIIELSGVKYTPRFGSQTPLWFTVFSVIGLITSTWNLRGLLKNK